MKLKLRKLSDDLGIDKENYLLQNLLKKEPKKKKKSSPCLSERELTSNKLDPVNVPKRYDSIETKLSEGESVELPTFGNWKEKINVSDENNRLEMYEKMRVKEIYTTSK